MSVETMVRIVTKPCFHCGQKGSISLPATGVVAYQGGALAQDAFPNVPAEIREQFISGIHPACFTAMFGEE